MTSNRGFTLIELLVVISIIGLLSSVVLASLSTTRARGKAGAVRTALISIRNQIELEANPPGTYGMNTNYVIGTGDNVACGFGNFNTTKVAQIKTNMASNLTSPTNFVCSVNTSHASNPATRWAIGAILPSGAGMHCVDNSGDSKTYSSVTAVSGGNGITTGQINNGECI